MLKRHRGQLYDRLKKIDQRAIAVVAQSLAGMRKLLAFSLQYGNLEPALRQVYEWRSRDLHDGVAFPAPLCEPPMGDEHGPYERFPVIGMNSGGGYWPADVLPMYLHTFAHIVGGALRNWWDDLPAPGPSRDETTD